MSIKNPLKAGDRVKYIDGDDRIFTVYAIYSDTEVSLSLADYDDHEQDYLTNINKIKRVNS